MSLNTPASGPSHARWVLVIEDLRDQAELCLDVCAQAGLNTTAAATGAQGCKKACIVIAVKSSCRALLRARTTSSSCAVFSTFRDPIGRR